MTEPLVDRVERLCRRALTAKRLREVILADLGEAMPFDGHVFMLTDPETRVATSPLADLPGLPWPRLPDLIRLRYLSPVDRWSDLLDDGLITRSLIDATGGDPARSPMWQGMLSELGVVDLAMVVFCDRYGCWGFLDLIRTTSPFSRAELRTLASLTPSVTHGLRQANARTFVDGGAHLASVGPAVIVIDPDLRVRSMTEDAAAALLTLNPPDEPMAPVPAAVYNVAGALLALEAGIPVGPAWSRLHLGGSRWVTAKAARIGDGDIAVSIEPCTPSERMDLFARAHALSHRESEVLHLLATGADSRSMAAALVVSEHTVNTHVKALMTKTGARTRPVLLSRAVGSG